MWARASGSIWAPENCQIRRRSTRANLAERRSALARVVAPTPTIQTVMSDATRVTAVMAAKRAPMISDATRLTLSAAIVLQLNSRAKRASASSGRRAAPRQVGLWRGACSPGSSPEPGRRTRPRYASAFVLTLGYAGEPMVGCAPPSVRGWLPSKRGAHFPMLGPCQL